MNLKALQEDMRSAFLGGGSGVLVSGMIWLMAGISAMHFTKETSLLVLFFGGMLIHPVGVLIDKLLKRSGQAQKGNPLTKLAFENTVFLFVGLFIAYLVYQLQIDWVFSIMLLIIGARYLTFQSVYGMKIYWALGFALIGAGVICLISNQPLFVAGLAGGVIELIVGIVIIRGEL